MTSDEAEYVGDLAAFNSSLEGEIVEVPVVVVVLALAEMTKHENEHTIANIRQSVVFSFFLRFFSFWYSLSVVFSELYVNLN